jgi:2-dehydropantoate 2-reductase
MSQPDSSLHPASPEPATTVLVMGTGSVGGYLAGSLQSAGAVVHCVARPRMLHALRQHGLTVSDLDGRQVHLPPEQLHLHEQVPAWLRPDLVLLTVKCGATAEAARQLATALPPGTPVLSMQNGLDNATVGAAYAPGLAWLAGMVPYNIAELGPGHLHRGTQGHLAAQDAPVLRELAELFGRAGLPLRLHANLAPVQWGKLLLNLNNPVNALSGLPLRAELLDRGYRQVFAALQREALVALAAAGIAPAQMAAVPPQRLPALLCLPNAVFRLLASRMLRMDDKARSSMADDLALGRPTEVDALCGEVARLARSHGLAAPLNERIATLVGHWPAPGTTATSAALKKALGMA